MAIYCYEGAGLILSLEGSVSKELRSSFKTIFLVALSLVTTLYIGFGVCGYLSFGPDTEAIITLNLPGGAHTHTHTHTHTRTQTIIHNCLSLSLCRLFSIYSERVSLFFAVLHLSK